ncbi:MFS transporter [Allosaccharopolyspora coralli]|uniref:Putative proline/betaine transporter n=1 Tax=Allosaccharopolyspora coralli TaxID=2665642 RepID=A0A5Q3Q180_9PSEU|nr:MFS transporter [Allosaccharopolyspora coralli]QGK68242.1 MFS transporter [Allosaccharopolyspora coralli]
MNAPQSASTVPLRSRRKAVVAASIGNFIEWFEFALYGFFAAAIAMNFFPGGDGGSLIPTFAAFGVSFIARPVGALVFGHFGDRMGRRGTLAVSILGMSAATFVIGILPSYETLGIVAPIMLVLARVVQGFSAGGEFGGATAFMVEYAPSNRRGLYASWQFFTQFVGGFMAAAVGAGLSSVLTEADLNAWGWRVPFIVTLPLGVIGFYLRLKLDETPQFTQDKQESHTAEAPLREVLRDYWLSMLKVMGLLITGTTSTYMIQAFLPAYLVEELGMSSAQMFTGMLTGMVLLCALIPVWALLSDRWGRRKPLLVISPLLMVICAVPVFALFQQATFLATMIGYIVLAVVLSPLTGALAITLADAFPTRVRYSGLSVVYSVGVSIFGGFTPLIFAYLVEATGNPISPGYYLAGTAVVSLIAALLYREVSSGGASEVAEQKDGAEPATSREGA